MSDPLADRLLDELRSAAGKRRRLLAVECDDALLEAAPAMQSDPDRRRRLLELLTNLRDVGSIEWSVARDSSVRPELPSFITLVAAANVITAAPNTLAKVPWRPELEWAYELRLTPSEHETLTIINAYRRDRVADAETIPHRERSLLLFADEKRLDRISRGRLFEPGRLTLELLDAFWAAPPIAWSIIGDGDCVVSENAASFHTLCQALHGKFGVVAYGAGNAFAQSIAGLRSITNGRILYIGDLDAEGVAIPQRAAATAERFDMPAPEPYLDLWELLVSLAGEYGQPATPVPAEVAAELCAWFGDTALAKDVQRLLEAGVRVPQEAIGRPALAELQS